MKQRPLISIVIPAYNAEAYVGEALESVFVQDYRPLEVIVVDDGSTDRTADLVRTYDDVHYLYQENAGIAGAMNTGYQRATGDYIASLDADDIWMPNKLARQIQAFEEDPELDVVFGIVEQFLDPQSGPANVQVRDDLARMPGYLSAVMLVKRDSFFAVGLFNTNYRVGDFVDWYLRAKEVGLKEIVLPEVLLRRRIHDANTGVVQRDARGDYLKVIKASRERRKQG